MGHKLLAPEPSLPQAPSQTLGGALAMCSDGPIFSCNLQKEGTQSLKTTVAIRAGSLYHTFSHGRW